MPELRQEAEETLQDYNQQLSPRRLLLVKKEL